MKDFENCSETVLIRRARRGDIQAFGVLYGRIYKELYRFALYTMRHKQDAEDVVSETVVAAYEGIDRLKKEESFRSWIFTILANQCKKRFLRKGETEAACANQNVGDRLAALRPLIQKCNVAAHIFADFQKPGPSGIDADILH